MTPVLVLPLSCPGIEDWLYFFLLPFSSCGNDSTEDVAMPQALSSLLVLGQHSQVLVPCSLGSRLPPGHSVCASKHVEARSPLSSAFGLVQSRHLSSGFKGFVGRNPALVTVCNRSQQWQLCQHKQSTRRLPASLTCLPACLSAAKPVARPPTGSKAEEV